MFTNIHDILLLLYNDKEKNIDENINYDDLEAGLYSDDEAGLYSDGEDVTKLLIDDEKTRFIESKEEVLKNTMDESVLDGKRNQKIDPKKDEKVVVVAKEKDNRQILGQRKELFVTSKEKVPKKQNIDKKKHKIKISQITDWENPI